MSLNIRKGDNIQVDLKNLTVEIGWKTDEVQPPYDLDVSAFLLDNNGKMNNSDDLVFYNSSNFIETEDGKKCPCSYDKSVVLSPDDFGENKSVTNFEEFININLDDTTNEVKEIVFATSIYWEPSDQNDDFLKKRIYYNFGQVRDAYIQIKNADDNDSVIARYDLNEDFSSAKGVVFGKLYRESDIWQFEALGDAFVDGLKPMVDKYTSLVIDIKKNHKIERPIVVAQKKKNQTSFNQPQKSVFEQPRVFNFPDPANKHNNTNFNNNPSIISSQNPLPVDFTIECNWDQAQIPYTANVVDKPGFLGLFKKSHQETRYNLIDTDVDLSCIVLDANKNIIDNIYSPLYRVEYLAKFGLPTGKSVFKDQSLVLMVDESKKTKDFKSEAITGKLTNISSAAQQIYFFINNYGTSDFASITKTSIYVYEGSPLDIKQIYSNNPITGDQRFRGKNAIVICRLVRRQKWELEDIYDGYNDKDICQTINRILTNYN
ncbi:MAG: TerD domain-containing protein [Bacteroidales bacterium]|nr:TerD domain-containing protein [Bacteroidales bacterium]